MVLLAPPALGFGSADPYALRLSVPFVLLLLATLVLPSWSRLKVLAAAGTLLALPASAWLMSSALSVGPEWLLATLPPVAYLVLTIGGILLWRKTSASTAPQVRLSWPSWRVVAVAVAGGAVIWAGAWLLPASWLGRWAYQPPASSLAGWIAVVIGCAALAGAQELAFRGVLLGVVERRWGSAAIPLQAVVFGFAHLAAPGATSGVGPLLPFVLVVVALGLIWGWVARQTDSLLPSWTMHTIALVFLYMFVVGVA
ncbi:MAG: CPBP family intramembrane glutamic endopeptidase [Candidatus Dormibacteria bacterium]